MTALTSNTTPNTLEENPRILAIAKILSDGKPHTAGEMAFALQVTSKTVRRYLHFMRDEMRLPIENGRFGFFVQQ